MEIGERYKPEHLKVSVRIETFEVRKKTKLILSILFRLFPN